jgi:hypothetical protein
VVAEQPFRKIWQAVSTFSEFARRLPGTTKAAHPGLSFVDKQVKRMFEWAATGGEEVDHLFKG